MNEFRYDDKVIVLTGIHRGRQGKVKSEVGGELTKEYMVVLGEGFTDYACGWYRPGHIQLVEVEKEPASSEGGSTLLEDGDEKLVPGPIPRRLQLLIWYVQWRYTLRCWWIDITWLLKGEAARARRQANRKQMLNELTHMSQDLGLYDE